MMNCHHDKPCEVYLVWFVTPPIIIYIYIYAEADRMAMLCLIK